MKGEDIVDDTCWIVKSHSPWIMPFAPPFSTNKVIVIVRNPMESNISWLNCIMMGCHSLKVPFQVNTEYPNFWNTFTRDCMNHMNNWYQTFMKDARMRKAPILFVRFEDLASDPEPSLYRMMEFILGERDLTGTNAERRIKEVIAKGSSATQTYKLKDSTKKYNSNNVLYTAEQKAWITEHFKEMLHFFGYANVPQDPDNYTGYYDYAGTDPYLNNIYKGYERQNDDVLNWVNSMSDEEMATFKFDFTPVEKDVPLLNFSTSEHYMVAVYHYLEKK